MKLSVIICTYNRAKYLSGVLQSILQQKNVNDEFEVIVINNNSTDDTENIVTKYKKKHPSFPLKYFIEYNQGLSFARNRGIKEATGEIISFIDDDAIAYTNFISELLSAFDRNSDFKALGGKILPIYEIGEEPKWMSRYIERIVSKVDYGDDEGIFPHKYPVGCNMAFKKEVFKQVGGFNTSLNLRADDKYIFDKIKKTDIKVLYAPKVIVEHNIEKERTTKSAVIRISQLNGRSDRIRINTRNDKIDFFINLLAHKFKFFASIALFFVFLIKGKILKGTYLIIVMYHTYFGFLFYKKIIEYKKQTIFIKE